MADVGFTYPRNAWYQDPGYQEYLCFTCTNLAFGLGLDKEFYCVLESGTPQSCPPLPKNASLALNTATITGPTATARKKMEDLCFSCSRDTLDQFICMDKGAMVCPSRASATFTTTTVPFRRRTHWTMEKDVRINHPFYDGSVCVVAQWTREKPSNQQMMSFTGPVPAKVESTTPILVSSQHPPSACQVR